MRIILKIIVYTLFAITCICVPFLTLLKRPSNNRNWSPDQKLLSRAEINGNLIKIYNIRNFKYETTNKYIPGYYDKIFDLNKIKSVDFILEPFSIFSGAAHTFLSFGFEGDDYLAISIEIRKKMNEKFSALKGLFNKYEIMYVVADERDVVKLRANYRKDKVYVYPFKTAKETKQALFLDMIKEVNRLNKRPKFYNTLLNTCATNIVKHVNSVCPQKIPFNYRVLLPGYVDELTHKIGLIDTDLSLEKARETFLINEKAEKYAEDENFSALIRKV